MNKRVYVITEAFRCFCEPSGKLRYRKTVTHPGYHYRAGVQGVHLKGCIVVPPPPNPSLHQDDDSSKASWSDRVNLVLMRGLGLVERGKKSAMLDR